MDDCAPDAKQDPMEAAQKAVESLNETSLHNHFSHIAAFSHDMIKLKQTLYTAVLPGLLHFVGCKVIVASKQGRAMVVCVTDVDTTGMPHVEILDILVNKAKPSKNKHAPSCRAVFGNLAEFKCGVWSTVLELSGIVRPKAGADADADADAEADADAQEAQEAHERPSKKPRTVTHQMTQGDIQFIMSKIVPADLQKLKALAKKKDRFGTAKNKAERLEIGDEMQRRAQELKKIEHEGGGIRPVIDHIIASKMATLMAHEAMA